MNRPRHPLLLSALAAATLLPAAPGQDPRPGEGAAPAWRAPAAVERAAARAAMHNKRVLAVFAAPGDDLLAALKKDKALSRPLLYEFECVALTGDDAVSCGKHWRLGDERPAVAVLDAKLSLRSTLGKEDLLADGKLAAAPLLDALKPHFCAPVDAEEKLTNALTAAKKTGRFVFVRFDAPW
jgi:hypothetical protein